MVGWHHRLDGHEFKQAPGFGDGQGSLSCCSPWGRNYLDTTEQLNWLLLYTVVLVSTVQQNESAHINTLCVHVKSLQLCPTLGHPMDCSPAGYSVQGILQARILKWVAMSSSRESSQPRYSIKHLYLVINHLSIGQCPMHWGIWTLAILEVGYGCISTSWVATDMHSNAMVHNLLGSRDWFCGGHFFPMDWVWGGWFQDDSSALHLLYTLFLT